MPTRSGLKSTTPIGVVESAQNVGQPKGVEPTPTPIITRIYARPTGSDSTGNGTLSNPYATMVRAIQDVPLHLFSEDRYIIDITGLTEDLDGYSFPPITSQVSDAEIDFAATVPWEVFYTRLQIYAEPQLTHTIAGGEISAQNADPNTGMYTIVTTNSYTPDELKGKIIVGSGVFEFSVVAGNTATDIEHAGNAALTAPIMLYDPGAVIKNSNTGSTTSPLVVMHAGMAVSFGGVSLEHDNPSIYYGGLTAWSGTEIVAAGCRFNGVSISSGSQFQGFWCYYKDKVVAFESNSGVGNCVFDNLRFTALSSLSPAGEMEAFTSYFLGCSGTLLSRSTTEQSPAARVELRNCEIRNAEFDGITKVGGALHIADTNINNSAGWAIRLRDNATAILESVKGTGNGGTILRGSGCLVTKDASTDIHGDGEVVLYARVTGNDDTGDGTLANPYASLVRALDEIPPYIDVGERYTIDITGITETADPAATNGIPFPAITGPGDVLYDTSSVDANVLRGDLNIVAQPQLEHTITAGEIVSQTQDAITGHTTISTSNTYTPDELKGYFVIGSGVNERGIVTGNTASDIVVTKAFSSLTAPVTLYTPGATIVDPVSGSWNGLFWLYHNVRASVVVQGINIDHQGGAFRNAISGGNNLGSLAIVFCKVDGLTMLRANITPYWSHFYGYINNAYQVLMTDSGSLFDGVNFRRLSPTVCTANEISSWNGCFDGCTGLGDEENNNEVNGGSLVRLRYCAVKNGVGSGIAKIGGGLYLEGVRIDSSANYAVRVMKNCAAWIDNVTGTGNGGGLLLESGAQVEVTSTVDVNTGGSNELKVGNNAATTWATFRGGVAPFNEVDPTIQLARLVQES